MRNSSMRLGDGRRRPAARRRRAAAGAVSLCLAAAGGLVRPVGAVDGGTAIAIDATAAAAAVPVGPGPEIFYAPPPRAPQLENAGVWAAPPILVSGASAYRAGEFLYQDFLYDDLGASSLYSYPTDPKFAGNAADFVEVRVRLLEDSTAFRITYNSMLAPETVATTLALGSSPTPRAMPHGANTRAPAEVFVTVHGATVTAVDASTGALVSSAAASAAVDVERRQVEVRVPFAVFDARGRDSMRLAAATGIWDVPLDAYAVPQARPDSSRPGGASGTAPTAFFNAAFRYDEPIIDGVQRARESQQASALAAGDLSPFFADVDLAKLRAGADDDMLGVHTGVPRAGFMNRVLASRFESKQGRGSAWSLQSAQCGGTANGCAPEFSGQLQRYSVYVPSKPPPADGYGVTILLHGAGGTANNYQGSTGAVAFGERGAGSIVFTPEARGQSYFYFGQAAADVFEVWADLKRHYPLDPANAIAAGGSMGGYGAYKLAATYPDLFAAAVPVVPCPSAGVGYVPGTQPPGGAATAIVHVAESLRHVPTLSLQSANDQLCTYPGPAGAAAVFEKLDAAGIEYEARTFAGPEHALVGGLILNQPGPLVTFAERHRVVRDPALVSYVFNAVMHQPEVGMSADHAYWISNLVLADAAGPVAVGTVRAFSHGFGEAPPAAALTESGAAVYPNTVYAYRWQSKGNGSAYPAPAANRIDVVADNIKALTIDTAAARVRCDVDVRVVSETPVAVVLEGC